MQISQDYFLICTKNGTHLFAVLQKTRIFAKKLIDMAVLNFTSREFRSQQAHVFDLADKGDKIIIRRSRKQAYTLVPIDDDDLTITPELQAKIDKAREEYRQGNYISCSTKEELQAYLDSL